jgi:hypothetical protein
MLPGHNPNPTLSSTYQASSGNAFNGLHVSKGSPTPGTGTQQALSKAALHKHIENVYFAPSGSTFISRMKQRSSLDYPHDHQTHKSNDAVGFKTVRKEINI